MRGTQPGDEVEVELRGIIPAYAGNTISHGVRYAGLRDHPRVCGEHDPPVNGSDSFVGSSPRMRGTPQTYIDQKPTARIIPAYAGNTLRDYSNFVVSKFMSFVFHLV